MAGALILLGLGVALAQESTPPAAPVAEPAVEPAAEPTAAPTEAPAPTTTVNPSEEMVVWGERVGEARSRLDLGLRGYGYEVKRKRDGVTVYGRTGTNRWKPKVLVSAEGVVWFRNPRVVIYPPLVRADAPQSFTTGPGLASTPGDYPDRGELRLMFPVQFPGRRIQKQEQGRVLAEVGDEVQALQAAHAGEGEARLLQGFPDRLDQLWNQGVDPRGGPALPDAAARKAALIELYRTRANTSAGAAVRAMIQDYITEIVQSSPTPLTEEERAAAVAAGITLN